MKKHLFGLGAMLVGAGLMFVLMHGEVMADDPIYDSFPFVVDMEEKQTNEIKSVVDRQGVPEPFVCSDYADVLEGDRFLKKHLSILHCRVGNLTCGVSGVGISCLKTKSGLFK
jgi:hypothetical protein